ncbi:MAG: magnesium transporter [Kiritimatiellales bacterium]
MKKEDPISVYAAGTAGAAMTSSYATLLPEYTAVQAMGHLREVAPDKETIYYSYVVDQNRQLLGFVSLKDLILAPEQRRVDQIMHQDFIFCRVDDDQEDAARTIQKYDLIALPVVDSSNALAGIITYDDAIDIIVEEQTEDIEKFMAITGSHETAAYLKTSSRQHFKNRAGWLVLLAVLGLISGFIVQHFEGLLMQFTILAAFMPMLADTGGNTGSQAATLVIRALALREITARDSVKILYKEFKVSILLALLLSILTAVRVALYSGNANVPGNFSLVRMGFAISLALGLQVITSTLIGALLPLGAAKLKYDPAVIASPALTTIVDITGLAIFFFTVKIVMGL